MIYDNEASPSNSSESQRRYKEDFLDFSYLEKIQPYNNDRISALPSDVQDEIAMLDKEINKLNIDSIPFQKTDYVVLFLAGILGAVCDILLGKPANGYGIDKLKAKEPTITNDFAGGLGRYLKKYDLKNSPIDKAIPGAFGGNHRLYSDGHDLLKFFHTVSMMFTGTGKVGVRVFGKNLTREQAPEGWMEQLASLNIKPGDPSSYMKLAIVLALHLYKDYCSIRSLPIPGSSLLASLNHEKMPEFMDNLTNEKELNLRTLNGQVLSVSVIEIINGIYSFIMKHTSEGKKWTTEQHKHKKEKMLLFSHSTALAFNVGKVVITQNPVFINFPQIIRIITLVWNVVRKEMEITHHSIEKVNLAALKNQYKTAETMILLDKSIYYTDEINKLVQESKERFDEINTQRSEQLSARENNIEEQFGEINSLMVQLKNT